MKNTITLKKNYEFKKILQKGKWYSGKFIRLYLMKNNNETENKIGFVVSKKAGNSVFRNRTRRIIREAYSKLECDIKKGYKLIIMWKTRNEEKKLKSTDILEDLQNLLKESELI